MKEELEGAVAEILGLGNTNQLSIEVFTALNEINPGNILDKFHYIIGRLEDCDDFEAIAKAIQAVAIFGGVVEFFGHLQKSFLDYISSRNRSEPTSSKFPLGFILGTLTAANWLDENKFIVDAEKNDTIYVRNIFFLADNILLACRENHAIDSCLPDKKFEGLFSKEVKKFISFEHAGLNPESRMLTLKKLIHRIYENSGGRPLSMIGTALIHEFTFAIFQKLEKEEKLKAIYAYFNFDTITKNQSEIEHLKENIKTLEKYITSIMDIVIENPIPNDDLWTDIEHITYDALGIYSS